MKWSADSHGSTKFYSRRDARRTLHELQGRYTYVDCCELELWPAHSKKLPSCRAYEANLVATSLKYKKTYEVASYDLAKDTAGPLTQLQSKKNKQEVIIESKYTVQKP